MALIMLTNDLCCAWDGSSTSTLSSLISHQLSILFGYSYLSGPAQGTGSERHSVFSSFLLVLMGWGNVSLMPLLCDVHQSSNHLLFLFTIYMKLLAQGYTVSYRWYQIIHLCSRLIKWCHQGSFPMSGSMGDVWARIGFSSTLARSSSYS